jgi:hypothetical protein
VPQGLPNRPAPIVPPPGPEPRRTESHRGQAAWAPPAGPHRRFSHSSAATNRRVVSSSSFSTHPPAESPTGVAQFSRAALAGRPRGHIAKQQFFPRAFLQLGNSNSKVIFLILVNCVENRRKIRQMQNRFCRIRCELSYNFCYSCLS